MATTDDSMGFVWAIEGQPCVQLRFAGGSTYRWFIVGTKSRNVMHHQSFPDGASGRKAADAALAPYLEAWGRAVAPKRRTV